MANSRPAITTGLHAARIALGLFDRGVFVGEHKSLEILDELSSLYQVEEVSVHIPSKGGSATTSLSRRGL